MSYYSQTLSAYAEQIHAHVANAIMARAARLEAAVEAALVGGTCGVLVDGDRIEPDERVPYGRIYDVSACGAEAVLDWGTAAPVVVEP